MALFFIAYLIICCHTYLIIIFDSGPYFAAVMLAGGGKCHCLECG